MVRSPDMRTYGWSALSLTLLLGACSSPTRGDYVPTDGSVLDAASDRPVTPATDVPPDARRCNQNSDCDDGIACTDEECIVGHVCEYTLVQSRCTGPGERCFLGRGCASGRTCTANADCDDSVACTQDLCLAGGMCSNVRNDSRCQNMQVCISTGCAAAGSCVTAADCDDRRFCTGVEQCVSGRCQNGPQPDCADSDMCTGDVCNDTTQMCEHPPIDPCGGTVMAGLYRLDPAPAYSCGAGTFGPVNNVTLMLTPGGVQVTGFPVALTGSAPSGGMFSATGSESRGPCQWRYTLSGSFTMAGRFTGTWNVNFDVCEVSLGCMSRSGLVTGTRP